MSSMELQKFMFGPAVVAHGEDIDAASLDFPGQGSGQAKSGGGIFSIGNAEIDLPFLFHLRQPGFEQLAAA